MIGKVIAVAVAASTLVVCALPIYVYVQDTDADYSETVTVGYDVMGGTVAVEVPSEDRPHLVRFMIKGAYAHFVKPEDPAVLTVASAIEDGCGRDATDADLATAALSFVQDGIAYKTDRDAHGRGEWWQLPCETLRLGTGDCEDKALLLASICEAMGIDTVIVVMPGHVATGIAVDADGHTVGKDGIRYVTADPTSDQPLGKLAFHDVEGVVGDDGWVSVGLAGMAMMAVWTVLAAMLIGLWRWFRWPCSGPSRGIRPSPSPTSPGGSA